MAGRVTKTAVMNAVIMIGATAVATGAGAQRGRSADAGCER